MHSAGFDLWGVVPAEELSDAKSRFEGWLDEGHDYRLDYLRRNVDKRFDARLLLEGARTIIVGAVAYKNHFSEGYGADCDARIASYALSRDYHISLRDMFSQVAEGLGVADRRKMKICVDSAPAAEKTLAKRAGIGWIGRNSLIISPKLGSFVVLGELLLTDECDQYSLPYEEDGCVGCGRCLLRCPTGAILPTRALETSLCISNRTIEEASQEPFDTHGWIFGCDECQSCCPHNATTPLFHNPLFTPRVNPLDYDSNFWADLPPAKAKSLFEETPLTRKFKNR